MNGLQVILLGAIQGLTEFLPISSSGHLVIAQHYIGIDQPGALFEAFLHMGTLLAILIYFKSQIMKMDRKYLGYILIGTVPAVIIGFLFQGVFEALFSNIRIVGLALIITGVVNLLIDRLPEGKSKLTHERSVIIGVAQAVAIIPGISRSGSTIFAGTKLGLSKKTAAEFSFLLSVPAILGANALQLYKYGGEVASTPSTYLLGFVSALVVGYFAIDWVMKLLIAKKFSYFAYYLFVLGVLVTIIG